MDAPREPLGAHPGEWIDGRLEEPRQRMGGVGTPEHEVLNVSTSYWLGIPSSGVSPEDVEWLTAEGIDAVPIDPDDPPTFESQARYLERHGLLSAHERRRLPADAFEPEKVQARS